MIQSNLKTGMQQKIRRRPFAGPRASSASIDSDSVSELSTVAATPSACTVDTQCSRGNCASLAISHEGSDDVSGTGGLPPLADGSRQTLPPQMQLRFPGTPTGSHAFEKGVRTQWQKP